MALKWDKVVPPEIVAKIKKDLLSKDANLFYGEDDGAYNSRRYRVRRDNNVRVAGGSISKDGKLFYDVFRKRWVKLERAILEKKIFFRTYDYLAESFLIFIEEEENGFMNRLIPLLANYAPETEIDGNSKKPHDRNITNRLNWLTYNHKPGGPSRNFIDPFFHNVLDVLEKRLDAEIKKVVKNYG